MQGGKGALEPQVREQDLSTNAGLEQLLCTATPVAPSLQHHFVACKKAQFLVSSLGRGALGCVETVEWRSKCSVLSCAPTAFGCNVDLSGEMIGFV